MPVPISPKPDSLLSSKLVAPVTQASSPSRPIWEGPESDGPNGGVTQSLLGRFLCCRERFRLLVVEGLRPSEGFNHRLGYGTMWHVCEENYLAGKDWRGPLDDHCRRECLAYPMDRATIEHWWAVCCTQFPIYVDYWSRHTEAQKKTPILQEFSFRVPYKLPSGRVVYLRGKWDSVDLVGNEVWLTDHKTKGDLDAQAIVRQMSFDLQTMFYLVALYDFQHDQASDDPLCGLAQGPIRGVYYNCVRRPLSGGKGTIVQKKGSKNVPPETREEFYARLGAYIREDPGHYFMRFACEVSPSDIATFRQQCLDPLLEQLCDWWSWVKLMGNQFSPDDGCENSVDQPVRSSIHYRYPFGVYNPLNEGRSSDLDNYLATGSDAGLTRVSNLFPEL